MQWKSGSRAWGFPSPDSDYDCRFVYVRSREDYLSLWPRRDVIETPLDGLLDVSGWDVTKALRLAACGNAVVVEWLRSPVIHRGDQVLRDLLAAFCTEHAPVERVRRHYLHLAIGQRAKASQAVKKLFYLLRPTMALRWMRLHPCLLPPMHFPTLLDECDLPTAVRDESRTFCSGKQLRANLVKLDRRQPCWRSPMPRSARGPSRLRKCKRQRNKQWPLPMPRYSRSSRALLRRSGTARVEDDGRSRAAGRPFNVTVISVSLPASRLSINSSHRGWKSMASIVSCRSSHQHARNHDLHQHSTS